MKGAMLGIGADKGAVREARAAIMAILNCRGNEDATKRTALETLAHLCKVSGVTVSNCTFTGGK